MHISINNNMIDDIDKSSEFHIKNNIKVIIK